MGASSATYDCVKIIYDLMHTKRTARSSECRVNGRPAAFVKEISGRRLRRKACGLRICSGGKYRFHPIGAPEGIAFSLANINLNSDETIQNELVKSKTVTMGNWPDIQRGGPKRSALGACNGTRTPPHAHHSSKSSI